MQLNKVTLKTELSKEKRKLDDKIMKLNNLIRGEDFVTLKRAQQILLQRQSAHMTDYSLVLRDRIVDITSQES